MDRELRELGLLELGLTRRKEGRGGSLLTVRPRKPQYYCVLPNHFFAYTVFLKRAHFIYSQKKTYFTNITIFHEDIFSFPVPGFALTTK